MCVTRTGAASRRGGDHTSRCTSSGGRSLFFANSVAPREVAGGNATRQSHIS
jgi:hypothetical protein